MYQNSGYELEIISNLDITAFYYFLLNLVYAVRCNNLSCVFVGRFVSLYACLFVHLFVCTFVFVDPFTATDMPLSRMS